jgi:hypothetical protein
MSGVPRLNSILPVLAEHADQAARWPIGQERQANHHVPLVVNGAERSRHPVTVVHRHV